jgi:hypothetical protein
MNSGSDLFPSLKFDRDCLPPHFISVWIVSHHNQFQSRLSSLRLVFIAALFRGDEFRPRFSSSESVSSGMNATGVNFGRNVLSRNSIIRLGMKIPYMNKWRYRHGSGFTATSSHDLASSKPRSGNHSDGTNHLMCDCRTPPVSQTWFQCHH